MSAAPQEHSMSIEAYFALETANPTIRYEYLDGQILLMSGGSRTHALISANVIALLIQRLSGSACLVFSADGRVKLNNRRYVYPDVSVSCAQQSEEDDQNITEPLLVVEVLSDGTADYDRGQKSHVYQECPSITSIILIAQDQHHIEVHRRQTADRWATATYGRADEIMIDELGITLPIAQIYQHISFAVS